MSNMLAFFDGLDCFRGPRPNDSIPLLYLVDILAAMSWFNPLLYIRNTFFKDIIRPKLDVKHNCLQSAARALSTQPIQFLIAQ